MQHSCTGAKKAGLYSQVQKAAKNKVQEFHGEGMEEFAPNVQNIREDMETEGFDAKLWKAVPGLLGLESKPLLSFIDSRKVRD